MPLIEWRKEFEIGISSVDHEHREMIDLINELHGALSASPTRDDIVAFLGEINARISAHFALEEREMRNMRYDEFEEHKADHERLLDEISDITERYEADAYLDVETELATRLRVWFTVHFKTRDARLHKMLG